MDLYTLDSQFLKKDVIDTFVSAIWTERYSESGDVDLVVAPTPAMISKLAEGTFLSLNGSDEVMILETQSIENNQLTVRGKSLLEFLKQRLIRTTVNHREKGWFSSGRPLGAMLAHIVDEMVITGVMSENVNTIGFDGPKQIISNLTLGDMDLTGPSLDVVIPYGTVYDGLRELAQDNMGMSLYLYSANAVGYSLKFKTYLGLDRTSDQSLREVVRFSRNMDSLMSINELRSITGYKNVAYAFATSEDIAIAPGIAYADPSAEFSDDFDRRTLMVFADDITLAEVGGIEANLTAALTVRAKDALANHNFTRVVDGEVVPHGQYTYGEHYGLGDTVELQGYTGITQKARITEYIRTEDNTGERAYPTVSLIE